MRKRENARSAKGLFASNNIVDEVMERRSIDELAMMKSSLSAVPRQGRRRRLPIAEALEPRVLLSVSVTNYHNDAASTGQNTAETLLTSSNVQSSTFGKLFSTSVDGQVYTQPLVVSGLSVNGSTHTVVFIATEHDSVYAIDAGNGQILWQKSFINPANGVTTVTSNDVGTSDISPEMGITSTPIIDPATNTIYLVAMTKEIIGGNTHFIYRLHALDMSTSAEKFGGPMLMADTISNSANNYTYVSGPSIAGNGAGSSGGIVHFNVPRERQREALTLVNGVIYIAFASFGDNPPYHGWILGYNASNLQLSAVFCDNPNSSDDGIWNGGGEIEVDPQGFLYFETGNGGFDSTLNAAGFPSLGDYGDSFVKVQVDPGSTAANPNINGWGLKVVDYFTPFNEQALANGDTDLGSGDIVILPDSVGSAAHPHLMFGGGKEGRLYLIDRDNMGHFDPNTDHVVQELPHGSSGSLGTPAYFNGQIYTTGGFQNDFSHAYSISNGVISTTPVNTPDTFSFPGSTASISSNGNSNGIVWTYDRNTAQLRAYSAANYSDELYTSAQAPGNRDALGASGVKFAVPTVANGQVFVGTSDSLVAFGLLNVPTTAPAPPTNLTALAVSSTQVNLNWADQSNNESGFLVEDSTDGVNFSQIGGTGAGAASFSATKLQPQINYTFRVRAYNSIGNSGYTNTATAKTPAGPPPGVLDFSSGFSGAGSALSLNGSQTAIINSRLQLTDGNNNENSSVFSNSPVDITKFNTQFSFQLTNATADGFTFIIQNGNPNTLGPWGGALGYGTGTSTSVFPNSLAIKFDLFDNSGEGNDSTGLYLDGAMPTQPSVNLSNTPINLHSGDVMNAALSYDGTTLGVTLTDTKTGGVATQSYTINIPQVVNSSSALVGFTAATGGAAAVQDILSWTFTPTSSTPQVAAPTGFSAGISTGTQISLNWSPTPGGAGNILIERSINGGAFSQISSQPGNVSHFLDTQLMTGTTYSYRIRAQQGSQLSGYTSSQTVITPSLPPAPSGANITSVTSTSVSVAWTDNANNADGYRVYRLSSVGGQFILVATLGGTAQSFNDSSLPSGTVISYDIEAFNLAGFSAGATVDALTIAAPPASLTITPAAGQNTLNWTAPTGAVTYNVYRGTSSGSEGTTPFKTAISGTNFVDSNLSAGQAYFYQVTAVNSSGESVASNEVSAQTPQTGSGQGSGSGQNSQWISTDIGSPAIAGSSTLTNGNFSIAAAGDDIWSNSDQFHFTYQPLAGDGTIIAHVDGVQNTFLWAKAGVMIRESLSATSNHVSMLLTSAFGVHEIYRNASAPDSVDISGNDNNGVTSYWVKLVRTGGTVSGFQSPDGNVWTPVGGPIPIATGTVYVGLAVTSHMPNTLTTGTFDHVTVTGAVALPPPPPPGPTVPKSPSNLNVGGTAGGQVNLNWTDNSTDETGFHLDRATDSQFTQNLKTFSINSTTTAGTGNIAFTDSTTTSGITYFYRVRSTNAAGDSTNSNTATLIAAGQPGSSLPSGWSNSDIGGPGVAGNATFNGAAGAFTLVGGGSDIWWGSDQFQYAYQSLAGDGTIIAHVQGIAPTSVWAKAGVMIRQSLAATSNFAMMLLSSGEGVHLQSRTPANPNGNDTGGASAVGSYWVKLIRTGGFVTGYQSSDGINWVQVGSPVPIAAGPVFIGLALTSHNNATTSTATFDHVSVTTP